MKKLVLIALAAGAAAFPAGAIAQTGPFGPGVTVSQAGNTMVRHGGTNVVRHGGGQVMHPGPNFRHQQLQRGFVMHPFWFGPQFHVQNWQLYGFAAPRQDQRWVRYYDDAYLIDRQGQVQDSRHGLDWDQYGERWASDDGIPSYYGRGEWRPDERDYAWVEGQGAGANQGQAYAQGEQGRYEQGYGQGYQQAGGYAYGQAHGAPPPSACHPAPPQPCGGQGQGQGQGYGYGAGYGYYGYGVAYPIIIETTVWSGGTTYYEEVTEEVVEVYQRERRHYRPQPRPRPRPRPPAGERG